MSLKIIDAYLRLRHRSVGLRLVAGDVTLFQIIRRVYVSEVRVNVRGKACVEF